MLTWIMFLKFLDDLEQQRGAEATLARQDVPPRHRAALPLARLGRHAQDGITGDELLAFINQDEMHPARRQARPRPASPTCAPCQVPTATTAATSSPPSSRASHNRMISGYLLRDVINKVNGIHFTVQRRDPHPRRTSTSPCSARCATPPATPASSTRRAPSSASWSTVTDPRLGETVLDPACGTGGFLVEAYQPP